MKSLPLPLRLAAGLAATAVERARDLPGQIVGLPVTVASQALQASMRLQQHVTELAIKGDQALAALRPVEETPEWATFDEDVDGYNLGRPAFDRVTDDDIDEVDDFGDYADFDGDPTDELTADSADTDTADAHADEPDTTEAEVAAPEDTASESTKFENTASGSTESEDAQPEDTGPEDTVSGGTGPGGTGPGGTGPGGTEVDGIKFESITPDTLKFEGIEPESIESPASDPWEQEVRAISAVLAAPTAIPNYDELSLPQLRARLRSFSVADLEEALAYERAGEARPSFVGMLTRRIATVRDQT
jgi:hypothetical protein